jgi:hypothetical protein
VEINKYRNRQYNVQTAALLKQAAWMLKAPETAEKLTAMNNPFLNGCALLHEANRELG